MLARHLYSWVSDFGKGADPLRARQPQMKDGMDDTHDRSDCCEQHAQA